MLSNASETLQGLASNAALDPNAANALVLQTAFDRPAWNASTTYRSASTDTNVVGNAVSPLLNGDFDRAASRQCMTDERDLSFGLDATSLSGDWGTDWQRDRQATIAPLDTTATGRSLPDAYPIATLSSPQSIVGVVNSLVTENYYRFAVDTTASLNLSLDGLTADADLQLIRDANGNGIVDPGEVLAGSYNPNNQSESITGSLAAGTYFIRVYQYSGSTSYTLNAFAASLALPPGYSTAYGYGLVDASAAITSALGQPLTAIAPNPASNAWDLNLVNAPTAWANGYTGQGIIVAVVDTGIDITHPDLNDNIWTNPGEIAGNGIDDDNNGFIDDVHGWDFVDRDNAPLDLNGHGTHVAGTIAAEQNGFGVTGVAYNATLMPVRVLGLDGGSAVDVAAGIRYAADNGARVINLSLGGGASSAIADAVQYATQRGALVVMAAGNDGGGQPTAPANLANKWGLAVGAIDINEKLATFSNRAGASPLNYVVAPGVNIVSTTPNNTYQSYSGTSMATPHVAGVAALLLSANPNLTPAQLTSLLTATATAQGLTV